MTKHAGQATSETVEVDRYKLCSFRTQRDLTQEQLAVAIGRTRGWISRIERVAGTSVSSETAQRLAKALGVEPAQLVATNSPTPGSRRHGRNRGDLTFGTPSGSSDAQRKAIAELRAVHGDLKSLTRRVDRVLAELEGT
jgi:transcriptional regulator with XRE-family HTH domain